MMVKTQMGDIKNSLDDESLVLALPKGRIEREILPFLQKASIEPEEAFFDEASSRLVFSANGGRIRLLRVRSFDVASFVAFGAAHMGICGRDVLMEFNYDEIYVPLDLNIGQCRMVVAESADLSPQDDKTRWSHIRVATKYPLLTRRHFLAQGIQAECIKLHGSVEIAPGMGLCDRIVDLVSTGDTLKANQLVEVETIAPISSCLIVNRTAMKTRGAEMTTWIARLEKAASPSGKLTEK